MNRAAARAAAVGLLWASCAAHAQPVPAAADESLALARQACRGIAASAPQPLDDVALLRVDPPAALARACERVAQTDGLDAALGVAEALAAVAEGGSADGNALAAALRRALPAAPAAPALWARWHLLQGLWADNGGRRAESAGHFARARAALAEAGQAHSARYALALLGQASAWFTLRAPGDLALASAALDDAAALLAALGAADSLWMSDLLNLRSNIAYAQQDLPGTLRWAQAELALMQRIGRGDDPELLHTLTTIGSVLTQLNRLDEAQAAFEQGQGIIARHPQAEPYGQQGIYSNLAVLHFQRGQSALALPLAERSVELSRAAFGERGARTVLPLTVRAEVEADLSLFARSRASYEAALALAVEHAGSLGPLRLLRVDEGYARVLLVQGDADAAQARLDQALRTVAGADGQLGYWRGRVLRRRAAIASRAQDWAAAEALLAEAEPLIASVIGARHPYVAVLVAERCAVQTQGRLPGSACERLRGMLDVLAEAAPRQRFAAFAALAIAAEASGQRTQARDHHLQALAAALGVDGPEPRWSAYDALARHLRRDGDGALAVLLGKQAVVEIEALRADLAADARRFERGFLTDKQGVYQRLADWLTEDGRIDEALLVLRLLRQEEFSDFVRGGGRGAAPATAAATPLSAREQGWLQRWLPQPAAVLPGEAGDKLTDAERESQRQAFRRQAEAEAARVLAWQALLGEALAPAAPPPTAPPGAGAAQRIAAGELWLWAYAGEQHLNLVLASAHRREVRRLPLAAGELARAVGRLLGDIGRRAPADDALRALYPLLGAPLAQAAERAGARRVVLQVSGVLRYVPFAALSDGRHALGERFTIEQRIDGSDQPGALPLPPSAAPTQVRAFGVTQALAGMTALPALAREVCGIVDGPVLGLADGDAPCRPRQGALPGRAWLNDHFTRARLAEVTAAPRGAHDVLHLGTHFSLRPGHIGRSWLLLGDGQRLTLDQLSAFDFTGLALVTLSACETGLGGADGVAGGQEVEGLNLLVMRRGAAAVLASLWRVEDDSTGRLMGALYRGLARGRDAAQALREAQAAVRQADGGRWAHPFYWAGFYLATRR